MLKLSCVRACAELEYSHLYIYSSVAPCELSGQCFPKYLLYFMCCIRK